LVLTTDRSGLQPDDASVSLAGQIDVRSKVPQRALKDLEKKKKVVESAKPTEKSAVTRKAGAQIPDTPTLSRLRRMMRISPTGHSPPGSRVVHSSIDDQTPDIVRRAADTVLKVLTDSLKTSTRRRRVPGTIE